MTNKQRWDLVCDNLESPQIFIDYTFYGMISCALERRVWLGSGPEFAVYPNQYIVCVADPGVGKSVAADVARDLFKSIETVTRSVDKDSGKITEQREEAIHLAPNSTSLRGITKDLEKHASYMQVKDASGKAKTYQHSSIAFLATGELGSLFKTDAIDLVRFFTEGWDCKDYRHITSTQGEDDIKNLCINMIGCCTPDFLTKSMEIDVFNEGMTARTIFLYDNQKRKSQFFYDLKPEQRNALPVLRNHLRALSKLYGQIEVTPDVRDWCETWYATRNRALNSSRVLKPYYGRKKAHLMKMAMAVHFAESTEMRLYPEDFEKALELLGRAELNMDSVLRGIGQNQYTGINSVVEGYLKERAGKIVDLGELMVQIGDRIATRGKDPIEILKVSLNWLICTGRIVEVSDSMYEYNQAYKDKLTLPTQNTHNIDYDIEDEITEAEKKERAEKISARTTPTIKPTITTRRKAEAPEEGATVVKAKLKIKSPMKPKPPTTPHNIETFDL